MGLSDATVEAKWFFQFVFCAVSLAIVWGTTLERIKFGVYMIYAVVFSALIYPIASGWVFGGGWLQANVGMQDFAGSTAVHLIGATGALAALLLLGAASRQVRARTGSLARSRATTCRCSASACSSCGSAGSASTRARRSARSTAASPRSSLVTQLAACAGVLGAIVTSYFKTKTIDIGMAGNGAIGALVAITAPSGYVAPWAGVVIGFIAGVIVPLGVYAIDKRSTTPSAR